MEGMTVTKDGKLRIIGLNGQYRIDKEPTKVYYESLPLKDTGPFGLFITDDQSGKGRVSLVG